MKIKNLLLASLAVAAMTACSNEEEFIDNSIQAPTGEEATMRVNFTSVTGKSRAITNEDKDAGSSEESTISTATIVLDYGGNKIIVKNNLTLSETNADTKEIVASTPAFSVAAGSGITIYAFVNPSDALNAKINAASTAADFKDLLIGAQVLPATGLDYLASSITEENKFLMSGSKENITIIAGKDDNKETINVDRVSAKLDEQTKATDAFKVSTPTYTIKGDGNWLVVKFAGHSYSNLVKDSYVLANETTSWRGETPYLQIYKTDYRWITDGITYCLENKVGGTWTEETKAKATNVHYKAQVYYATGAEDNPTLEEATTFYVKVNPRYDEEGKYQGDEKTIYKSWADMREDYTGLEEEEGDAEYLAANGIIKYENGLCYYEAAIQHEGKGCSIIRNNWYQLAVKNVKDLGWPTSTPPTPDSATKLTITANIQPWTIQKNDIDL